MQTKKIFYCKRLRVASNFKTIFSINTLFRDQVYLAVTMCVHNVLYLLACRPSYIFIKNPSQSYQIFSVTGVSGSETDKKNKQISNINFGL